MKHVRVQHNHCELANCPICDGGLFICRICNGAEGTLTADCPGIIINQEQQNQIYQGKLDYVNGKWIRSLHGQQ